MTTPEHRDVSLSYQWQPSIRITLVDDDNNQYEFPRVGVWLAEHHRLVKDTLSRAQCRALWRWLKRDDKPPSKLWVMLNKDDVMRAFPETKPWEKSP
jgi:hypothetical protein